MTIEQDARALIACTHPEVVRLVYFGGAEHCGACGASRLAAGEPWTSPTLVTNLGIAIDRAKRKGTDDA